MLFDLDPPHHGGDLEAWQRRSPTATHWLDLSSACNREPWSIPDLDPRLWYELPDQTRLYQAAETFFRRRPIAIGAGTQQFIEALPSLLSAKGAGKKVMVPRIGYQEHRYCWQKWGYQLHYYGSFAELFEQDWDIAVVIHPNNPTGMEMDDAVRAALTDLLASKPERYLVVDEAFLDAAPEKSWLQEALPEHCIVLRSAGKFFGLAGARVGFAFGVESWRRPLNALIGPWPVATPALAIMAQALEDSEWYEEAKDSLCERNTYFETHIVPKLNTVFDSQDRFNTLLFYTWEVSSELAARAFEALHSVGVHVRLGEGWIRVSLPAGHEMERLNNALVKLLQGHQLKELG